MITVAFTCSGPYAILIMLGIKRVENRGMKATPQTGRCAVSCSKKFCKEEYGEFVKWASQALKAEDFASIPAWCDVQNWPGKIVGCVTYSCRERREDDLWDEGFKYCWDISNVVCFEEPIPCSGKTGLWPMPEGLSKLVTATDNIERRGDLFVQTSEDAAMLFRNALPIVGPREGFFVLPLDAERKPLNPPVLVSLGTESNTTAVSIADVFREAIKVGADAIIVAHNHPGGTLKASLDDVKLTRELSKAADFLGVKLLDHLIVTKDSFVRVAI